MCDLDFAAGPETWPAPAAAAFLAGFATGGLLPAGGAEAALPEAAGDAEAARFVPFVGGAIWLRTTVNGPPRFVLSTASHVSANKASIPLGAWPVKTVPVSSKNGITVLTFTRARDKEWLPNEAKTQRGKQYRKPKHQHEASGY